MISISLSAAPAEFDIFSIDASAWAKLLMIEAPICALFFPNSFSKSCQKFNILVQRFRILKIHQKDNHLYHLAPNMVYELILYYSYGNNHF